MYIVIFFVVIFFVVTFLSSPSLSSSSLSSLVNTLINTALTRPTVSSGRLTHLDLSMNQFDYQDISTLATALKSNRTLLGLHCLGNEGTVDCRGFLIPKRKVGMHTQLIHLPNRCIPLLTSSEIPARIGSGCWICGKWKPIEFVWTVGRSEGFNLVRKQLGVLREMFAHHSITKHVNAKGVVVPGVQDYLPKILLKEMLTFLHIDMEQDKLLEVANLLDRDGSGRIEFGELVSIVSRCLYLQTNSKSGSGAPSEILLVTDFGSTYVNEEPITMTYDSTTRNFTSTIMCPPTKISYHFIVEGKICRCAADQPMASPAPPSTLAELNRWKYKKSPALDALVFPINETLALRYVFNLPLPSSSTV